MRPERPGLSEGPAGQSSLPPEGVDDSMSTDPLEILLERALRTAAVPVEVRPEQLAAALAERRRGRGSQRPLVLLAAAAILVGGLLAALAGFGGLEPSPAPSPSLPVVSGPTPSPSAGTGSPEPSGPARPSPSASAGPTVPPGPFALPLPLSGQVVLDHIELGASSGSVARRWLAMVEAAAAYRVGWVCQGPGTFAYAIGEQGTQRLVAAPEATACDGRPRSATFDVRYPDALPIYVVVDRRASWRFVVAIEPLVPGDGVALVPLPAATGTTSLATPDVGVFVLSRSLPNSTQLVVDAVAPDGDRGRIAIFDLETPFYLARLFGPGDGEGDGKLWPAIEQARLGGGRFLAVPAWAQRYADGASRTFVLLFDLHQPDRPPTILFEMDELAWAPDGRLAYLVDETLYVLDPATGAESRLAVPPELTLEAGFLWLADGSGFLTARQDLVRGETERGVLTLDGTFAALEGRPLPATFSPTGQPRYPAHGREIGGGCDLSGEEGPVAVCAVAETSGPDGPLVIWWRGAGPAVWTADGEGVWLVDGDDAGSRLLRLTAPERGSVVAAWDGAPAATASSFVGLARDDSALLLGSGGGGIPEVRWVDPERGTVRLVTGAFAGWTTP